jgi:integrase
MASTSLYFDKRRPKSDGTFPVKIKVSLRGNNGFLIPTSVSVRADQWSRKNVIRHPNSDKINTYLHDKRYKVDTALYELELSGRMGAMPAKDIKIYVISALSGVDTTQSFIDHFNAVISRQQKEATRGAYTYTLLKVRSYDSRNLLFTDITVVWLRGFERYLQLQGLSVNSINLYMRNIRAVINDAINIGVTSQINYPFRLFKLKLEQTRHKALTINQLCELRNAKGDVTQRKYIDMFMLMFYLGGINSVDLCNLREIKDGNYIEYRRAKTGKLYRIKVEPEALEIINRYRGRDYLLNILDNGKSVQNFTGTLGRSLSTHAQGLSSNWARHTWATIAASLDIPKDTIAAVLGHGAKTVTDIYIAIDQRRIDNAIRKVINYLNLMT